VGLVAGSISILLNALLFSLVGAPALKFVLFGPGAIGSLLLIVTGGIAGGLGSVVTRLQEQSNQLAHQRTLIQQEIAERQQITEHLRHERDLLNRIMETSPTGIILMDETGKITFANTQAEQVLGISKVQLLEQMYNALDFEIVDYEGNPVSDDRLVFQQVITHQQPIYDVQHAITSPSSQKLFLSINAAPIFDQSGKLVSVVLTLEDRTAHIHAERQLQSHSHFQALVADLSTNFISVPLEAIEEAINHALQAIGEFVKADRSFLLHLHEDEQGQQWVEVAYEWTTEGIKPLPPDRQRFAIDQYPWSFRKLQALEVVTLSLSMSLPPEATPEKTTLEELGSQSTILVPMSFENHLVGVIGFAAVKAKRTWSADEISLLKLVGQVFANIQERRKSQEKLLELTIQQERIAFLRALIRDLSHDFRTPLSIMNTNIYLLEQLSPTTKQKEKLETIKLQTSRFEKLLENIMVLSQLDWLPDFTFNRLDLNHLVRTVKAAFRAPAEEKGISLETAFDKELPHIFANEDILYRAIANLLENAIRYTPPDGQATVRTYSQSRSVLLEVQDTGVGISPSELPHIFNRFYRADKSRHGGGTGLGLAIVKKVIEIHQGKVEVESEPGQGSLFRLRFPHNP